MSELTVTRRTFLKAAAVTGAGVTLLGAVSLPRGKAAGESEPATYEWVPNICTMCVNTCGIKVKVKKTAQMTRAIKIDGNPDQPYNRGKLCARGQAGLRRVYDPERITTPLIRVEGSKRGEWSFRRATWEEAYQYIGMKMQQEQIMSWEIAAAGGWVSCAFYRPYLLGFAFALATMNVIIKKNLYDHCFVTDHTNLPHLTVVSDQGAMPAIEPGGPMELPRAYYVYDKPSASIKAVPALIGHNGVDVEGNPIEPALEIPAGLTWNGQPVRTWWQLLRQKVAPYTPEWASRITDVPAETIERIATEFGSTRPALMEPGWHDTRYGSTVQFRKVTTLIQGLVGGIDKPGGWVFIGGAREIMKGFVEGLQRGEMPKSPLFMPGLFSPAAALQMRFNNADYWQHKHPAVNQAWNEQEWQAGRDGIAFSLYTDAGYKEAVDGSLQYRGQPYNLKAFVFSQTNLVRNFFGSDDWKSMLQSDNVKLVVAIEIGQSDSLPYADVILPDTAYLEKYDPVFEVGMSTDLGYTTRRPAIPPPGQVRHTLDIFNEMATGFGVDFLGAVAQVYLWDAAALKAKAQEYLGQGRTVVEAIQAYQVEQLAHHIHQSSDEMMETLRTRGVLEVEHRDDLMEKYGMPWKLPLSTPSGRMEFFSMFMAGLVRNTKYTPHRDPFFAWVPPEWKEGMAPEDSLQADDEFFFTYGKLPTQSHAATMNNDLLTALSERHAGRYYGVWIHPARAGRLGIATGDRITITNQQSGQQAGGTAFVTELIRPDTIFIASSFGGENPNMRHAYGKGTPLSALVARRYEPVVGGFRASEMTVRVAKA